MSTTTKVVNSAQTGANGANSHQSGNWVPAAAAPVATNHTLSPDEESITSHLDDEATYVKEQQEKLRRIVNKIVDEAEESEAPGPTKEPFEPGGRE